MTIYKEYSKSASGRIIANTRPSNANIYLDGEPVIDTSGQIATTPTVIYNVAEGLHTVTFSRSGHSDITIIANVSECSYCNVRAVLNTSMWSYPMMMSEQQSPIDILQEQSQQQLQPSPGWPYIPVRQITYGHMVANTSPDEADIYIDNQPVRNINGDVATTPSSVIGIVTGIHTITFKKAGYRDTSVIIEIQNGLYSDARATLQPAT
jgi:hypothetical protein